MPEVHWDKPKEVPEWVIQRVDDNVLARKCTIKCHIGGANKFRASIGHSSRRNLRSWNQLLDTNGCNSDKAGERITTYLLPEGLDDLYHLFNN